MHNSSPLITKSSFGALPDGREICQWTLTNTQGMTCRAINFGGIITSLNVPDRHGRLGDVVLGFDNLHQYLQPHPRFGALIGRFANRIAHARFKLDGEVYTLAANKPPHHLHGGMVGFDKVVWYVDEFIRQDGAGIRLSYKSPDGEEGYPGNLKVDVDYFLSNDNALEITYRARTDKKTIINLTHHCYFNLSGQQGDILHHELQLRASQFLQVDETLIPTGEIRSVAQTPLDFTNPRLVGRDIAQLNTTGGYDHCFVLDNPDDIHTPAATLYDPASGRRMELYTTEPGIQLFTANFGQNAYLGKKGATYWAHHGICLETQHFPDSPNRPDFPTVILNPDEEFRSMTKYVFTTP